VVQDPVVDSSRARLEAVYRAESTKIWRALVGFTGDEDVATDAMAEAFTRALHHGDSVRDVAAWTWRVAFRVASAELRERIRRPGEVEHAYEMPHQTPDLVRALRQIPPKQRLAVVLHDYADRPVSEVAAILGASRGTVYVHLSQGRKRLRDLLEERHA
jgi:RNA polymerase sigma-70 factor (ECF subfamily)